MWPKISAKAVQYFMLVVIVSLISFLMSLLVMAQETQEGQDQQQIMPEMQNLMSDEGGEFGDKGKSQTFLDEKLTQKSDVLIRPTSAYLSGGPRISLHFTNASIEDVLSAIAQQTDLNLIISDKVGGKTTVHIENVPAKQAIKDVLDINGLYYIEEANNVVKIVTEEEYRKLALSFMTETRVFKIFQGDMKSVANAIAPALTERVGKIIVDEKSRRLVITDVPGNMERIIKILEPFTKSRKKIKIFAHILEIGLNDETQLGVNWEAAVGDVDSIRSGFSNSQGTSSQGNITIMSNVKQPIQQMRPNDFVKATLRMMGLDMDVTTLATPTIMANDSEMAYIHVGRSIPYNETTTAGVSNSQTTSFKFLEVGTKLTFLPQLMEKDNIINLRIKIEVSSSNGFVSFGKDGELGKAPEKVSTTADTMINLKNGQTIIIGGLLTRSHIRETAGVPFLKDLPIIKFIFGSSVNKMVTNETVVFITPVIISEEHGDNVPYRLESRIRDIGTKEQIDGIID